MERSLNIPDPQVLLHFPDDGGGFFYHHRVLLHKVSAGRWVCLTPDLDLEVQDLNARRHVILGGHAVFPDAIAQECYIFDELSRNELERQKKLAKTMGAILDDGVMADVAALQWFSADPSSSQFGKPVPAEIVEDIVGIGQSGVVS